MRLVNPCDHLNREARMFAHASAEILEAADVFDSLEEALRDIDLSIATTAKQRDARKAYLSNRDIAGVIESKGGTVSSVAVVFGGEESGLSNDQIRICDLASTIPLKQDYPSLNLAQAVMIYAYTLANLPTHELSKGVSPSGEGEFKTMMDRTKSVLTKLEMDRSPALYNRVLERVAMLGEDDVHLLLSVLARIE